MSKLVEKLELYSKELTKLGIKVDENLLKAVTKACGPSIYTSDGELVAASDKAELARVKTNFLTKKLAIKEADQDAGIAHAIETIGKSNRNKYRPVFYYILVQHYKKASLFK